MLIGNQNRNRIDRAVSEVRRGSPVMIYDDKGNYLLFTAAEILERSLFDQYKFISGNLFVTLTSSKVQYSFQNEKNNNKRLQINSFDELLHLMNYSVFDRMKELYCSGVIDKYAIDLLKLSELLPYALIIDSSFKDEKEMYDWCEKNDVITLNISFIKNFCLDRDLYEICETSFFLKQTQEVKILSYRIKGGSCREHYAIIVGNPNRDGEPLVRIHSSCYTGDLLGSLSCDCRSQLHKAIQIMVDSGGGVIIYLMQDGRGIGLINKLRAYDMQRRYDLDTVDANKVLGFKDDERDFVIAAKILKKLDLKRIQLLTNNGRKLSELKSNGIEITKCLPLVMEFNQYNCSYMKTKFAKLGHKLKVF
ncbi:MAG: GTP cyclohydrolase II [Wolbachia endosymbiont of Menacanthus eurysternus]|nr:MAG: GTP cyclohydrolase II [Wolbachia endosymbiont of Menacanthus eurysternus]WFW29607.1 MAG: GTP cyclohydrolase II [Wolbachia endosymbiont of Menacanthus eurysternus]